MFPYGRNGLKRMYIASVGVVNRYIHVFLKKENYLNFTYFTNTCSYSMDRILFFQEDGLTRIYVTSVDVGNRYIHILKTHTHTILSVFHRHG